MNLSNPPSIRDFMTPDPAGIDEELTLADATDRMLANNIRHLLVLRDGELVGVVDSADLALANAISQRRIQEIPVTSAVRGVFRCAPDTPIEDAIQTMERNHYTCAVVVDDQHHVVGIFTVSDAFRALRRLATGRQVAPEVAPTLAPERPAERVEALPKVRVSRILASHRAGPNAAQGLTFGKVGL